MKKISPSYFLNIPVIIKTIGLKILDNIYRMIKDYPCNFERLWIYYKRERAIFLTTTKTFSSPFILSYIDLWLEKKPVEEREKNMDLCFKKNQWKEEKKEKKNIDLCFKKNNGRKRKKKKEKRKKNIAVYSFDCREAHMKKNCLLLCLFVAGKVKNQRS